MDEWTKLKPPGYYQEPVSGVEAGLPSRNSQEALGSEQEEQGDGNRRRAFYKG